MRQFTKRTHTFYQYAAMYFAVLFIFSGIVILGVLRFSADKLVSLKTQNTQNSMRQAADILEKQYQTMESIAIQIGARSDYHPSSTNSGALYDIELLKDFKSYVNYSPLTKQYFLVYSAMNKIYTSTGNTSYFDYYAPVNLNIPYELTSDVLSRITKASTAYFERSNGNLLMVFPLEIYASNDPRSAALCFVLTESQIKTYLEQMTVGLPEQYIISMDGAVLLSEGMEAKDGIAGLKEAPNYLEIASPRGKITFSAVSDLKGWHLLFTRIPICCFSPLSSSWRRFCLLSRWRNSAFGRWKSSSKNICPITRGLKMIFIS